MRRYFSVFLIKTAINEAFFFLSHAYVIFHAFCNVRIHSGILVTFAYFGRHMHIHVLIGIEVIRGFHFTEKARFPVIGFRL